MSMKPTYEQLEQQLAAVVAENAGLKESRKNLVEFIHEELNSEYPLNMDIKTPATDAYLAEVRAQGVEMFAERKHNEMMSLHPDTHAVGSIAAAMSAEVKELREFAAQLRQGAEHE